MFEEILKEIAQRQQDKEKDTTAEMQKEMGNFTLRENVERILKTVALLGAAGSAEMLISEKESAFKAGLIAAFTTVCESLDAALQYSKKEA